MRLLLLNTFDLSEESISVENISSWISHLNYTHPERFEAIASKIEDCSLEAELDTVNHPHQKIIIHTTTPRQWSVTHQSTVRILYSRLLFCSLYLFLLYFIFLFYFRLTYYSLSIFVFLFTLSVYSLSTFSRFVFLFYYSLVKRPCPYILVLSKYFICPYIFAYIICRKIYFQIGLYFLIYSKNVSMGGKNIFV